MRTMGTLVAIDHDDFQRMAHEVMPLERCHFCAYDDSGEHVLAYCAHHLANPDPYIERPKPLPPEGPSVIEGEPPPTPEQLELAVVCSNCAGGVICSAHLGYQRRPYIAPALTERPATPEELERGEPLPPDQGVSTGLADLEVERSDQR